MDSARNSFDITPHATNPLAHSCRMIWVGGAGNLVVRLEGDAADRTFSGIPAGTWMPLRATHVRATSTATLPVAVY